MTFNEALIDGVRNLHYVLDDDLPDATDQLAMDLADEFGMDVDDVFVRVCNAHEISLPLE